MKNIYFLIVGIFLVVFAYAQQQANIGLISSLTNSELNTINSKISKFSKLIVSNNYQLYVSKTNRLKRHMPNSLSKDYNLQIKRLLKDSSFSVSNRTFDSKDSIFKTSNNNCCVIKYFLLEKGAYKYGVHVEGNVKDCIEKVAIPHAYVALNSAVVQGKYLIIPTTADGDFKVDVIDDSIGSITVIKKGYADKEVKLQDATIINENTSYAFNVCLDKVVIDTNSQIIKDQSNPKNPIAYFGFNKHTLNRATRNLLDSLIKTYKNIHPSSIELNGYTDGKGQKKYNLELSRERAIECKRYLLSHGLGHVRIRVHAYGSTNPVTKEFSDNNLDNPKARAMNRRVEIVINLK